MRELQRLIDKTAPSDRPALILGESGTGKELVARALHQRSPRSNALMVTVNCAALPETLLESEFFGHERGAFTGATSTKQGLFEAADGGTLFIDEIGELPLVLQAKLLRTLEDGSFRRVGSVQSRRAHVRIIAATNRDLAQEVAEKRFREDLYYRLNVLTLRLPPLRERPGDLPTLVRRFLGPEWEIEPQAMAAIERYHWPGNVRQLINAIERAKILGEDGIVRWIDLPEEVIGLRAENEPAVAPVRLRSSGEFDDLDTIQRSKIVEVLHREGGNKSRAANALGIARRKLYRLLEKHAIQDAEIQSGIGEAAP
jgi:transcriptional regulator with PAS, ATPase and Fis domain